MKKLALITSLFLISSCGITAPQDRGNAYKFTLSSTSEKAAGGNLGGVIVDFPKTSTDLDTFRIALLRDSGKRDYFAGARWADFLASTVQSSIVESLGNSGKFTGVTANFANFSANYELETNIQHFEADYTISTPPTIRIKMDMKLVNVNSSRIIKSFSVEHKEQAKANDLQSIYKAFNSSYTAIQNDIVKNLSKF